MNQIPLPLRLEVALFRVMKESPEVEPLREKQRKAPSMKKEMRFQAFPQEKGEERALEILAEAQTRPEGVEVMTPAVEEAEAMTPAVEVVEVMTRPVEVVEVMTPPVEGVEVMTPQLKKKT